MNSSAGMPLSTWTFLKTSSAISGFSAGTACAAVNAAHTRHAAVVAVARGTVLDPRFMLCPSVDGTTRQYTLARRSIGTGARTRARHAQQLRLDVLVRPERCRLRRMDAPSLDHHVHVVGSLHGKRSVLLDHQDRRAFVSQTPNQLADLRDQHRRQSFSRL